MRYFTVDCQSYRVTVTVANDRHGGLKMIVCTECGLGPLDRRALYRMNGALFHQGKSIKGKGSLFCAGCAPDKIKQALLASVRIDPETKTLAARERISLAA